MLFVCAVCKVLGCMWLILDISSGSATRRVNNDFYVIGNNVDPLPEGK